MNLVCVVTGATGGIGSKVVSKYLEGGYIVVMLDVCQDKLNDKIQKLSSYKDQIDGFAVDITQEDAVIEVIDKIIQKHNRIDVLVNCAGICGKYSETVDYSFDNFKRIYNVNVFGTFLMMQKVLPTMMKQHSGSIVNFGSVSGMRGYTCEVGYGSSKWAVIGMTENVANEYGKYGIRVNSVSPGWVNTEMMKATLDDYKDIDKEKKITIGTFNRPAEPEEIADAVYFLSSKEAKYITGSNLVVDGGMLLGS